LTEKLPSGCARAAAGTTTISAIAANADAIMRYRRCLVAGMRMRQLLSSVVDG
jgi:hypothetical protein